MSIITWASCTTRGLPLLPTLNRKAPSRVFYIRIKRTGLATEANHNATTLSKSLSTSPVVPSSRWTIHALGTSAHSCKRLFNPPRTSLTRANAPQSFRTIPSHADLTTQSTPSVALAMPRLPPHLSARRHSALSRRWPHLLLGRGA